ncbi:MAG: DUF4870 domain-containing protein [Planctomycetota bacterium]|nr:DUF4870 domain-containing protein [Planctomycetota bacterium]
MSVDAKAAAVAAFKEGWGDAAPPVAATEDEKTWGMLANLLGLFFVVGPAIAWFLKGDSKYVKFHALQMILVNLASFAVGIVLGVVFTVLAAVPAVGWTVISIVSPLFSLCMLGLLAFLALKAKNGVLFKVPALGAFAFKTVYPA